MLWQGELVYVNYGLPDDILYLQETHNISVRGKVLLARLGFYAPAYKVSARFYQHCLNPSHICADSVSSAWSMRDLAKIGWAPGASAVHLQGARLIFTRLGSIRDSSATLNAEL